MMIDLSIYIYIFVN